MKNVDTPHILTIFQWKQQTLPPQKKNPSEIKLVKFHSPKIGGNGLHPTKEIYTPLLDVLDIIPKLWVVGGLVALYRLRPSKLSHSMESEIREFL